MGTRAIRLPAAGLELPEKWATSSVIVHFEGEDLSKDPQPFAATVAISPRVEVPKGVSLQDVARADLDAFSEQLPGFKVLGQGDTEIAGEKCPWLEYELQTAEHRLTQLSILRKIGDQIYGVTGTHVSGQRFEAIRNDIHGIANSLTPAG